jgi:hypothetical protein
MAIRRASTPVPTVRVFRQSSAMNRHHESPPPGPTIIAH